MNTKNRRQALRCAALLIVAALTGPAATGAQPVERRQEVREGSREVGQERAEARHEIAEADNPVEARHEVREGARQVSQERREAELEIRGTVW